MDSFTILALIVASMLKYSAPLIFTSIGGTFSERGGIVNVGLEGIMVIGAFAGVLFNLNFADSFGDATPLDCRNCSRSYWSCLLIAPRACDH